MRAETIIIRAMIEMAREDPVVGTVNAISRRIYEYKNRGDDVSSLVTLQRTPTGFYSREVTEFVERLLITGTLLQYPIVIDQITLDRLEKLQGKLPT